MENKVKRPPGRPSKGDLANNVNMPVAMPRGLADKVIESAAATGRTRSAVIREALVASFEMQP